MAAIVVTVCAVLALVMWPLYRVGRDVSVVEFLNSQCVCVCVCVCVCAGACSSDLLTMYLLALTGEFQHLAVNARHSTVNQNVVERTTPICPLCVCICS